MGWWPFTRRSKHTGAVTRTLVVRAKPACRSAVEGRFDSAQTNADNRRHWANADGLSADASASPAVRQTLRNRARYEVANNSYARGIVLTLANDVTGTGPRLQMLTGSTGRTEGDSGKTNQTIEREFMAWAKAVDLPVIEVAFLNGQESPTIETAEADFNVLGIQMRGYHDFGVNLQDPSAPLVEIPFTWRRGEVGDV